MSAARSLNHWQAFDSNLTPGAAESNDFLHTFAEGGPKPLLHLAPLKQGSVSRVGTAGSHDTTMLQSARQIESDLPEPVILPKPSTAVHNQFIPIQKWEGVVLRKSKDSFFARLVDLTSQGVDEEAEFSLEEVPPPDTGLLQEGAVFYWDIGYLDQTNGQRLRVSSLRFRRLPSWSEKELTEAEIQAARLQELFASE